MHGIVTCFRKLTSVSIAGFSRRPTCPDSAAALQEGRADLAVVRPDVDLPDNGLTLAILRDQAMIIASPEPSGLTSFPELDRKRLAILAHRDADQALIKAMASALEKAGAAYDVAGYRDAPPGLRIWCGATVDTGDIEALGPWLDWAYATAKAA